VFFLAQVRHRAVKTARPAPVKFGDIDAWRIHVEGGRSEMHYLNRPVKDEFDVIVDGSGRLLALERTFYTDSPLFAATMTLTFSDHRASVAGLILPHRIERYVKGARVQTLSVSSYAFDVPTAREQFEPRRAVR
jgi:hypothetical protein